MEDSNDTVRWWEMCVNSEITQYTFEQDETVTLRAGIFKPV